MSGQITFDFCLFTERGTTCRLCGTCSPQTRGFWSGTIWSTSHGVPSIFVLSLARSYVSSIKKVFAHAGIACFLAARCFAPIAAHRCGFFFLHAMVLRLMLSLHLRLDFLIHSGWRTAYRLFAAFTFSLFRKYQSAHCAFRYFFLQGMQRGPHTFSPHFLQILTLLVMPTKH